jgi:hypothetical protein
MKYAWASPTTGVGMLVLGLGLLSGGRAQVVRGAVEVHGGLVTRLLRMAPIPGGAAAMTLGHVILGRDPAALRRSRDHEHVHVRQTERWGPLFLPAYGIASLVAKLRGQDPYYGNVFEREAYGASEM